VWSGLAPRARLARLPANPLLAQPGLRDHAPTAARPSRVCVIMFHLVITRNYLP
jgi:hypothetical protein